MTSLQLFKHPEQPQKVPNEWGTGKGKGEQDIWLPRTPTWHQQNIPIEQYYDLTDLKRSNLRDNDQLLPRPEASHMGKLLINKSFPSEHPYDSHISRFAVFPNFISPEDPIRGTAAQTRQPLHAEQPANSYDVNILHKTKGAGLRHEVLTLPKESEKKPLYWKGENHFDQVVKTHGNRQDFYPTPQKSVAPNLQNRPKEHQVSEKTADTMRNVERSHWLTTNQLDYTGLGPSNPMKLNNFEDKKHHFTNTGEIDDKLYPHFTNNFDLPRPIEGRIARLALDQKNPAKQQEAKEEKYISRKMTATEIAEDLLWNGKEYVNYPDTSKDPGADTRWQELDGARKTEPMITLLKQTMNNTSPQMAPFPTTVPPPKAEPGYLETTKTARDQKIQEMEAQNRWRVLESQTPRHDVNSLHYKYGHLNDKELPSTFYNHEGKYNEERAGIYKTSYDPQKLQYSLNKDEISGSAITDTSRSHEDALYMQTPLSMENSALLRRSKTFCGNTPRFNEEKQTPRNVSAPYHGVRYNQSQQLQPQPHTARTKVQEGELISKESTMSDSYNTSKFLQDNEILPFARNEPLNIMSSENQSLRKIPVRSRSLPRTAKSVQFSDRVTVAHLDAENTPFQINSTPLQGLTDDEKTELAKISSSKIDTTQYSSTQAEWNKNNELSDDKVGDFSGYHPSFGADQKIQTPRISRSRTRPIENPESSCDPSNLQILRQQPASNSSEYKNEYLGTSTIAAPSNLKRSASFRSSYHSQYPIYHDLSSKSDPRFNWVPGSGTPRPQTCLLALQDSFSKSDVKRSFNQEFSENPPEIRDHIIKGKRHVFNGVHGQLIHG